jgi:hypothetical protein
MPPSDGIPLQDRSRWSRKCPRVTRERSPSLGYVSNVPMVVTPQVFIFRSTTSMDLNTKYQWMKHMLNFNYLRPSRYRICFVGHEFDIVFIYPGSS